MNRLFDQHARRNAASRGSWYRFAPHRRVVTRLLLEAAPSGAGRLCVLGAGNCLDLDLAALAAGFTEVHLVDLDSQALSHGLAQQGLAESAAIRLHGGMDVTGMLDRLAEWSEEHRPNQEQFEAAVQAAQSASAPPLPGPFDVTASVCLLTQIFDSALLALGPEQPRYLGLVTALRWRHCRLLLELTRPGGCAFLITDVTSSETCPQLPTIDETALPAALARWIGEQNFFTGTNPGILQSLFTTDPVLAEQTQDAQLSRPWRWDFGPRVYAVCAVRVRKKATGSTESPD